MKNDSSYTNASFVDLTSVSVCECVCMNFVCFIGVKCCFEKNEEVYMNVSQDWISFDIFDDIPRIWISLYLYLGI